MFLVGPSWLLKLSRKAWNLKNIEKPFVFYGFWKAMQVSRHSEVKLTER